MSSYRALPCGPSVLQWHDSLFRLHVCVISIPKPGDDRSLGIFVRRSVTLPASIVLHVHDLHKVSVVLLRSISFIFTVRQGVIGEIVPCSGLLSALLEVGRTYHVALACACAVYGVIGAVRILSVLEGRHL